MKENKKSSLQFLMNIINDYILVEDEEGHILDVNNAALKILNYSRDEIIGSNISKFRPPQYRDEVKEIFTKKILTSKVHKIPLYTKDGKYIDVDVKVVPGKWNGIDAFYSINLDVSEKKELEGRFQLLFNFNPTAVVVTRLKDGKILDVNNAFLRDIKRTRDEVIGKLPFELNLWASKEERVKFVKKLLREKSVKDQETTFIDKHGNLLYVLFSAEIVQMNGEECIFTALNDITDRVLFEKKIQRSYEQESLLAQIAKVLNKERSDKRAFDRIAHMINKFVPSNKIMIVKIDEYAQHQVSSAYTWSIDNSEDQSSKLEGIKKINIPGIRTFFEDNTYRYYEPKDSFGILLSPIFKVLEVDHVIVIALKVFNKIDRLLILDREGLDTANDDSTKYFLKTVQNLFSIYYEQLMSQEKIKQDYEELKNTKDAVLNVLEDVAEQKRLSDALATDLKKFNLAVENATDEIFIANPDLTVIYANPVMMSSHTDILGVTLTYLFGKQEKADFFTQMNSTLLDKKQEFKTEIKWLRPSGDEYVSEVSISPILGSSDEIIFFVGLARDITKLKEIDRMKTEFISLASHQLRTPLSTMSWYVEMLKGEELGKLNKEQMDLVEQIDDSTKRMIDLVGSLLNVSRLESGRLIIEPLKTDFKDLIKGVLSDLNSKITGKNIKIDQVFDSNLHAVLDFRLIRNVVLNLLSNAVKYSPVGSTIKVKAYIKDNRLYCFVKDQGYGIPKKDYAKIFTKFFRASNITKYDTDGNGLGLYLCKSIVASSGGEIWFESTLGEGTTFAFWLPMQGVEAKKGEVYLDS